MGRSTFSEKDVAVNSQPNARTARRCQRCLGALLIPAEKKEQEGLTKLKCTKHDDLTKNLVINYEADENV